MIGWIKLHRTLRQWQWYDDHNATRLLIHLLISVNYEDKKWKGVLIKAGSMITSWDNLSKNVGLSVKASRIAMNKLESSGEVAREVTNRFQLITLMKWDELQDEDNKRASKGAGKGQARGRQGATTKEYKEYKEYKELSIEKKKLFDDWLDYRLKIKKTVKNEKTISGLLKKWHEHSEFEIEKTVTKSIDNQYQGLFWEKEKSSDKKETINRQTTDTIKQNSEGWLPLNNN